tara:strand:+ start:412 stop:756 length:345 start_codon:yes stop_codon:yes gene_type:complete
MRYDNRVLLTNFDRHYSHLGNTDNVKQDLIPITHYSTPELRFPTNEEIQSLRVETEIWKVGDRLFKYADKYYGSPRNWWVIAWYNGKPTEADYRIGDKVLIPTPLNDILEFFGY